MNHYAIITTSVKKLRILSRLVLYQRTNSVRVTVASRFSGGSTFELQTILKSSNSVTMDHMFAELGLGPKKKSAKEDGEGQAPLELLSKVCSLSLLSKL